ncbi:Mismatched base pair and cruciform DNA recognition protein [Pseudomonas amygdali pv. mellea]|nr:Mismatched base pair and cruciform DNA recognition protein [Pseudomonas amygdali pv. mellea]
MANGRRVASAGQKIVETLRDSRRSTVLSSTTSDSSAVFRPRRFTMSSTSDKAKGMANEAVGNVKQAVGKATDNTKLRAEGKAQELKGEGQQAKGKAKDAIKKGVDKA